MQLLLNRAVAQPYTNPTQRARVISERWVADKLYCPACQSDRLGQLPNNQEVADFACPACHEQFEVKGGVRFGPRLVDGGYAAMMRRLAADRNPNLVLLRYDRACTTALDLHVVPRRFFTPSTVEPRPPLGPAARRKGWVGCNIRLDRLPATGRITVIDGGHVRPEREVRTDWARLAPLPAPRLEQRAWLAAVLQLVEAANSAEFNLADIYRHEDALQRRFPGNRHIRPKIRQQLQTLRDRGVVEFLGSGRYRLAEGQSVRSVQKDTA